MGCRLHVREEETVERGDICGFPHLNIKQRSAQLTAVSSECLCFPVHHK